MFSAAFPLATLASALANFVELRTDAFKLGFQLRRPRYWGAQDIGTWQNVSRLSLHFHAFHSPVARKALARYGAAATFKNVPFHFGWMQIRTHLIMRSKSIFYFHYFLPVALYMVGLASFRFGFVLFK